jgi:hypothetical protein
VQVETSFVMKNVSVSVPVVGVEPALVKSTAKSIGLLPWQSDFPMFTEIDPDSWTVWNELVTFPAGPTVWASAARGSRRMA